LPSLKDSAKVDCLNSLSETYIGLPNWFAQSPGKIQMDSAEAFNTEALSEAKKNNYISGTAKALSLKAEIAFEKYEDYLQTEKLCREAIYNYKKSANKEGLYKTYWRLGTALYSNDLDAALNNLDTSYDLSKKAGDSFYVLCSGCCIMQYFL
jgi:hypothetical protein